MAGRAVELKQSAPVRFTFGLSFRATEQQAGRDEKDQAPFTHLPEPNARLDGARLPTVGRSSRRTSIWQQFHRVR